MNTIIDRIKIYIGNTGFKGFITIIIFFAIFWFGIDAFLKDREIIFIFLYTAGICTAFAAGKLLSRNSGKYTVALRIFIITAAVTGFSQSIPAVENFVRNHETVFTCVLFSLIGFFITGNFIVYSNPLFTPDAGTPDE